MEMLDRRIRNDVSTHEYFYFLQKKKKKKKNPTPIIIEY